MKALPAAAVCADRWLGGKDREDGQHGKDHYRYGPQQCEHHRKGMQGQPHIAGLFAQHVADIEDHGATAAVVSGASTPEDVMASSVWPVATGS